MQRQSCQVKTVLERMGSRKKTFLAFKDSLGNPLSRSPTENFSFAEDSLSSISSAMLLLRSLFNGVNPRRRQCSECRPVAVFHTLLNELVTKSAGDRFNNIFPVSDDFSGAFSEAFSVHYMKVINEIPPRKRSLYICF